MSCPFSLHARLFVFCFFFVFFFCFFFFLFFQSEDGIRVLVRSRGLGDVYKRQVGAGGTGSQMMVKLVNLHKAMIALGHPHGLRVKVVDPDVVSHANIGRQNFYPGDVGSFKADVLVTRANLSLIHI